MFCEKCGNQMPESAVFCSNCGASTQPNVKVQMVDNEVQLKAKPIFNLGYMLISQAYIWVILIILLIPFIIIYATIPAVLNTGNAAAGFLGSIVGCIILSVIAYCGYLIFLKMQYGNYSYDFYKTKVIFQDSFLNKSEKEVKYKYIREVRMRQTFFQRFFNLGNITLYTNAETGYGNGISIVNITNVQENYQKIKSIIDA